MLGQLAILATYAANVPLSRSFPQPMEDSAAIAVATVQLILAIILAPDLLPNFAAASRTIAGGAVLAIVAGQLANLPLTTTLIGLAWLALWILALIQPPRWLTAALLTLSLSGLAAAYAGAEAGRTSDLVWLWEIAPPLSISSTFYHPTSLTTSTAIAMALPGAIISFKLLANQSLRSRTRSHPATIV